MRLNGADIVLACLKEQGVDKIFGYPGGAVLPLYDALYKQKNDFTHILTSHEQGAVHAADGYARTSGNVGVCFVTSGPGATNTVTGIATAYMDSIPLVVITGQVASPLLGRDSFQEVDITAITLPITKHNYIVRDIKKLTETIRSAFDIASSGRPGPVLIDIPKDVFTHEAEYEEKLDKISYEMKKEYSNHHLLQAVKLINESKKPVIYAGGGIISSNASELLYDLSIKASIPVVNTLMGLGSFPRTHPLSLGMVGMHGLYEANMAVTNSDLIIAIGARFSDRVIGAANKFAPKAKVIHIDIDQMEIGKNKDVDLWLIGDIKDVLEEMLKHTETNDRTDWIKEVEDWKKEHRCEFSTFHPKNIIECAWEAVNGKAVVVTEVGQHQMWVAQHWKFINPRSFISSGGLGTMGYGLGAAIGAQLAKSDDKILHFAGDGCFRMNCNELATVSKYKLPMITILFNNSTLGMVRQWQSSFYDERYSETDISGEVDYIKLAEAFGIKGRKVIDMVSFKSALQEALAENQAMVIECIIDKNEKVYPFVPAGRPINEMILG